MYKEFLELIKKYDSIAIFRHVRPDGDAMFSALALYTFLKDNFKDKKVKISGKDTYEIINISHPISDSFIKKSLAVVVDTSNKERVDDQRFLNAECIVKIDHHPVVDDYGYLNIVDSKSAACCELLARILFSREFKGYYISPETCKYLYCGLVTDTLNFRITTVSYKTFEVAYKLVKTGDLKVYAKNNIDEIGKISDLMVWAFAVEEEDGLYSASLRSKRGYPVHLIARKYGGGGHANASGVKGITKKQLKTLFNELIELSTKVPENA